MATRAAVLIITQDNIPVCTWTGITEADEGNEVIMAKYPDKTVQVTGDFTTAGAITIEGSNNGTDWATLTDQAGNDLVLTDTSIALIAQNPLYIRPRASAGTAVSMTVVVVGAPR